MAKNYMKNKKRRKMHFLGRAKLERKTQRVVKLLIMLNSNEKSKKRLDGNKRRRSC